MNYYFFITGIKSVSRMKTSLLLAFFLCLIKLGMTFPISIGQKYEFETYDPSKDGEKFKQLYKIFMWFNNHQFFEPNVLN